MSVLSEHIVQLYFQLHTIKRRHLVNKIITIYIITFTDVNKF